MEEGKEAVAFSGAVHALTGLFLGLVLFHDPVHIMVAVAGALLPDADTRHSMAGKLFPLWIVLKHRSGFTHSLLAAALAVSFLTPYGWSFAMAFGTGYVSHLMLDSLTPQGVPLLYPISRFNFFRGRPRGKRSAR